MSAGAAPIAKTPSSAPRTVILALDIWYGLLLWELKAQMAAPTTRPTRQATKAAQRTPETTVRIWALPGRLEGSGAGLIQLGSELGPAAARNGWISGTRSGRMSMVSALVSRGWMRPHGIRGAVGIP